MSQNFATLKGTEKYANRFPEATQAGYFRKVNGLLLSSIGVGTYLGEMDDRTDELSYKALEQCLGSGVNVIDSAINYRSQRSERVIGNVIYDLIEKKKLTREEILISTKGGFIPFDGDDPSNAAEYFEENYLSLGILKPGDVVQGCHAMTPTYLENQLERSLTNLSLDTIDLYYIHNPETQLEEISERDFYERLVKAFELLEEKVSEGRIKMYGTATWNGCRISHEAKGYLSLKKVLEVAERAGGKHHHLRAIQLPYNLGMPEAFVNQNQAWEGEAVSAIEFARRANLMVFTSASLLQGRLAQKMPDKVRSLFPKCSSAASSALQFARSTPGVTTALVGMKSIAHISENLAVSQITPLSAEDFLNLFTSRS
ncbi:MAG: aldo/keto reductase [Candidatus Omnitrophica bacterium]|nr:aldo/keto reductase [Candidatus Omnitrophota bacterium]